MRAPATVLMDPCPPGIKEPNTTPRHARGQRRINKSSVDCNFVDVVETHCIIHEETKEATDKEGNVVVNVPMEMPF